MLSYEDNTTQLLDQLRGDSARTVAILADIRELLRVNTCTLNAAPHGHVPVDMPQEHAVPASSGARRAGPGNREGRAVNGPQNAIQSAAMGEVGEDPDDYEPYDVFQPALNRARHATTVPEVAFPTGPDGSLWWVQGIDSDQPVEGLATLEISPLATSFNTIDGQYEIRRHVDPLTEATRVVAVPLALLERLYESTAYHRVAALAAIHQIEQWAVEHGQTGE